MTEALLITATGARLLKVPYPPPPEWKIVRYAPVRFDRSTVPPEPVRNERICRRVSHRGEYPVVYEEVYGL